MDSQWFSSMFMYPSLIKSLVMLVLKMWYFFKFYFQLQNKNTSFDLIGRLVCKPLWNDTFCCLRYCFDEKYWKRVRWNKKNSSNFSHPFYRLKRKINRERGKRLTNATSSSLCSIFWIVWVLIIHKIWLIS